MNQSFPTRSDIDSLVSFLPIFKTENFDPFKRTETSNPANYPQYVDAVKRFFALAARECWCDKQYVPGEVAYLYGNDDYIMKASVEQLRTLITYCVRGEHFCDGAWGACIRSGKMVTILERLEELRESTFLRETFLRRLVNRWRKRGRVQ